MVEGSWNREDDTDQGGNDTEDYRAQRVIAEGVENFGGSENVETDEHHVVENEHDTSKLVGDP